MFTVKHTSPTYEDSLYSATSVRFSPPPMVQTVSSPPETVWVRREETGVEFPITDGVIYVMNDAGATVAKYDLEAKHRSPEWSVKAA